MVDVDNFKNINDTYGHLTGDAVLKEVTQRIVRAVRGYDSVGRYGGEEFLGVLGEQTSTDAAAAMERARAAVEGLALSHAPGAPHLVLTMNVGMASIGSTGERSVRDGIAVADKALYLAKADGGNRIRDASALK